MASPTSSSSLSVDSGDTISSAFGGVSQEKTNGTRLARLLIDEGTSALERFLLFSIHPETLEDGLKKNLPKLQRLKSRGVIFDDQWEKLFPGTGDPPNIAQFDITLLHLLIREISNLPPPVTGWHKLPATNDASTQANIARIKFFRNELSHSHSTAITESEFENKWDQISSALEGILVYIQRKKIQRLKNDPIDHDTYRTVEEHIKKWRRLQQQENDEPSSCLPDEVPEVFGRSKEINEVKQYLQSGTNAVVLITGGPGFGKTTVARETAHKLKENGHTVLFCSLLKKATFLEAATEMIHSCGTIVGQLPENPEYWLKNWSKQIQSQVVFVLDNADSLLESEADRHLFLETLSAVRMFSKQNVAFVITSRKRVQLKSLSWKEVNLSPLPLDEAKNLLISRVNRTGTQIEEFSKVETIVELCGCVPLALSIVGSLLSDYPEERIIEHLEKEPMTILEDDDESFQKAIMNSFDLLKKAEKDALVAVSIFPGSFDRKAAEAVLKEAILPITSVRSLKNRSLVVVEQPGSHRYQMHSLIRAFAKTIGETENPQALFHSGELACKHFISRLEENTRLYWGKDTCKAAIKSFSADRQNFEHFLHVFANGLEANEIGTSSKKFLDSLPQGFEYLGKCISPKLYIATLELLLKSNYFQAKSQPVHRVELLCLLGQEKRRLGDKTEYNDLMEEAHRLFSAHEDEFETKVLSRVFYFHSRARFLSEANRLYDPEPKMFYDKALKICEKNLPDHPETAVNLLLAGRNAKRRKKNAEATEKFKRAFSLFQKLLGDHFMTAQCLKDFADFVFFAEKSDQGLDKALEYYEKAMGVMEKLGTHEQKESILTLKNYGICHMKKGNFEEAENLLLKAELVCERELENADHTWKVMVKTHLGVLYHEMADKQENEPSVREGLLNKMEASMKEGLDMCYRLNNDQKSINHLGNKSLIRKVLTLYPERFPKELYPTL
ncbi:nephrocystin-3-like [Montipora foliosa]|uniref:nephrocystin-3-like n=1 Tax=Montipora foliosa TaxID=591990 RepID=UPI0035F21586